MNTDDFFDTISCITDNQNISNQELEQLNMLMKYFIEFGSSIVINICYCFIPPNNETELDAMLMDKDTSVISEIGFGFYTAINEFELDAILLSKEQAI